MFFSTPRNPVHWDLRVLRSDGADISSGDFSSSDDFCHSKSEFLDSSSSSSEELCSARSLRFAGVARKVSDLQLLSVFTSLVFFVRDPLLPVLLDGLFLYPVGRGR